MADFFRPLPATLRPHAKTHRTPAIARLQIAAGAQGITCAKVGMAEAMADGGITDLYIANQVVAREAITAPLPSGAAGDGDRRGRCRQ